MTQDEISRALRGDVEAQGRLIIHLRRVVHATVARELRRVAGAIGRNPREEVRDLVQDVLEMLIENDWRQVRDFDESRGSFAAYFGTIAVRHVRRVLRTRCRNPYYEVPQHEDALAQLGCASGFEEQVAAEERLDQILDLLEARLSRRKWQIFVMVYVDGCKPREVAHKLSEAGDKPVTAQSVSSDLWRVRKVLDELLSELDKGEGS